MVLWRTGLIDSTVITKSTGITSVGVVRSTVLTDSTVIIESTGLTVSAGVPNSTCLIDNTILTGSCGPISNRQQKMPNRQYSSQVVQALQTPEANALQKHDLHITEASQSQITHKMSPKLGRPYRVHTAQGSYSRYEPRVHTVGMSTGT